MKKLSSIVFATGLLSYGSTAMNNHINRQEPRLFDRIISNGAKVVQFVSPLASRFLDQGVREFSTVVGVTGIEDAWAVHVADKRVDEKLDDFRNLWNVMTDH